MFVIMVVDMMRASTKVRVQTVKAHQALAHVLRMWFNLSEHQSRALAAACVDHTVFSRSKASVWEELTGMKTGFQNRNRHKRRLEERHLVDKEGWPHEDVQKMYEAILRSETLEIMGKFKIEDTSYAKQKLEGRGHQEDKPGTRLKGRGGQKRDQSFQQVDPEVSEVPVEASQTGTEADDVWEVLHADEDEFSPESLTGFREVDLS